MTKNRSIQLKKFEVAYYLEQGFAIIVKARSEEHAERIVRKRLDDENTVLKGSTRVHYDDGIVSVKEVQS